MPMLTKGINKYIINPIIGMLSFVLYIVLHAYIIQEPYAIIISLLCIIIVQIPLLIISKSRVQNIAFYISGIAITASGILWLFGHKWIERTDTYILVGEIAIIVQLMFLRFGKVFIRTSLAKNKNLLEKTLLNDFLNTAALLRQILTLHVIIILTYKQIRDGYYDPLIDGILYEVTPIVIITGLCIYQFYRINFTTKQLRTEEWLPIIKEDGGVTGRIARSVSVNMGNKNMHPIVRVALICNGKIFLQQRNSNMILDPLKIDHPFEKYMLYQHDFDVAVQNCIRNVLGKKLKETPKFLFKYTYENQITNRLVFLFMVEINDETEIERKGKITGKFWTVKQIDEEFNQQTFSECFELEYEYLKHVILLNDADSLIALKDDL